MNRKKKIRIILLIILLVVMLLVSLYNYFCGKKKYIKSDIAVSSSCILNFMSSENQINEEKKALYIILIEGIKRDDFLERFEVTNININGEDVNLENIEYRHLNKALSIRMYSEKYNSNKGNIIKLSVKEKSNDKVITIRLHNTTEVVQ